MPIPNRSAVPVQLLTELRATEGGRLDQHAAALQRWHLRPLTGGRNNLVYAWTPPDATPICIKLYKVDQRQRAHREWAALHLLAEHGIDLAPAPLWHDPAPQHSAIGMTLLPGVSITETGDPAAALKQVAVATRQLHALPLHGPLATLDRVDSAAHHLRRLTDIWPQQLADHNADPLTPAMRALLRRWAAGDDAAILAEPAPWVFSHGDANLVNWLRDGSTLKCVDFEFAGRSDVACDTADLVEHISARAVGDSVWEALLPELGVTDGAMMRRFRAAQRTFALRWLAVLWRQRDARAAEFQAQWHRVRHLQQLNRQQG